MTSDIQAIVDLYKNGRYRRALMASRALIAQGRSSVLLHRLAGKSAAELGEADVAIGQFRAALTLDPQAAEVHAELAGELMMQKDGVAEAELAFRTALALNPRLVAAQINLGNLLSDGGRIDQAITCYRAAIALDPRSATAHSNLSVLLQNKGEMTEAIALGRRALLLAPNFAEAHFNMGNLLRLANQTIPAAASFKTALQINPKLAAAWRNLGSTLQILGDEEGARTAFRRSLAIDPDHPGATHMASALERKPSAAPPPGYVRWLFDGYAANFERDLVDNLGYRIPEATEAAVSRRWGGPPATPERAALDLGCGTGLVGQAIAPYVAVLDGVDIAPRMIDEAARKGVYSRLATEDVVAFCRAAAPASYDLVTAADVFIYVGALDGIFPEIARILRPGGVSVFSVESSEQEPFRLGVAGRYQHGDAYLAGLAAANGMTVIEAEPVTIRKEGKTQIPGRLYVVTRP